MAFKKKIILKKKQGASSISAQIAKKQAEKKKQELTTLSKPIKEPPRQQTNTPVTTSPKPEHKKYLGKPSKNSQPFNKQANYSDKKNTAPVSHNRKSPYEDKSKDKNKQLRENILQHEEHKKFFLQNKRKTFAPSEEQAKTMSAKTSIPKEVKVTEFVQIGELARKLNVKTSEIISKLMTMGEMVTITQSIDADTATLLAAEYGCDVKVVSLYDETIVQEEQDKDGDLVLRAPVVTIMGHVDHGKTKLLDALRSTDVVSSEAGGITQHIGAYQILTKRGKITFLDTPGHEAFTAMRARGANITDIVILVIAADDGVMPQTVEALKHAQDAKVPIIVAINKIDLEKTEENVEKVKQELSRYNLIPEDWGGETPFIGISALKKLHLDKLEDLILTTADLLELKADPNKRAMGTVIESRVDQGRGVVMTVLIEKGTIKNSDPFVAGFEGGRVRALFNDRHEKIKEAGPSTPVEILGASGTPQAGDPFHVLSTDKEMKSIVEKRQELYRQQQAKRIIKVKAENLHQVIEEGKIQECKIIVKADVMGSVEAIQHSLQKLSNSEVKVNTIFGGTGEISESDVMLASASGAIIIAFHTRANAKVQKIAAKESVKILNFKIIYDVVEQVEQMLVGFLSPDILEANLGEAEIREIFKIKSVGTIAGCFVTSGTIKKNALMRVIRDGSQIYEGNILALKRFKDDVNEVKENFECGISIKNYNDLKIGDILSCYEMKEVAKKVEDLKSTKVANDTNQEKQDVSDSISY